MSTICGLCLDVTNSNFIIRWSKENSSDGERSDNLNGSSRAKYLNDGYVPRGTLV